MNTNNTNSNVPVSVLIPTFNEEGFIIDCLDSVVDGSYPSELLEILVIDGMSTDRTRELVKKYAQRHSIVTLLDNEKKIVPAAMNIGLHKANNEVVIWLGAHAKYDPNYIVNSIKVLQEEKCASVGGVITPIGKTKMGKAIAVATTSKFGIGNAKYRFATKRQSVDTVFGGCWNKSDALKIGGFNELWTRNQDYEFNCRLRENVGDIILDPGIRCDYFCRESIASLAKQYFQYGFWRFNTFKKHKSSFTIRLAAPVMLLLGLLISAVLIAFNSRLGFVTPIIYFVLTMLFSVYLSFKFKEPSYIISLPIIFATLHLSWALGFLKNALLNLAKIR